MGIDGGGTKTAAVVIDDRGHVVSQASGGPSNTFHNPPERILESLKQAIDGAVDGLPAPACAALCGAGNFGESRSYIDMRLPQTRIYLAGERQIGFASAGIFEEHGLVVVAGTGSSFQVVRRTGEERFVGGWGSLLGDEGGAYDMAMRGIKLALRGIDGRRARTSLSDRLLRFFGGQSDSIAFVCATDIAKRPREEIAAFAREVSEAAGEGEPGALGIVHDIAQSLAEDAAFAAGQLFSGEEAFPVILSGGVFNAGAALIDVFCRLFRTQFPNATILRPEISPAQGAAELARYLFHTEGHSS